MRWLILALVLLMGCSEETDPSKDEFRDILSSRTNEYYVLYQSEAVPENTLAIYYKDGILRNDNFDETGESRQYFFKDELVMCTKPDEWTCNSIPIGLDASQSFDLSQYEKIIDKVDIIKGEDSEIAGTTTRCFQIVYDRVGRNLCFSPEGVVLMFESQGSRFTASEYSTSIEEDAFELPADPEPFR